MVRRCTGVIVAVSVLVVGSPAPAAPADPVADNAALSYWRAFSVLPNLDEKQEAGLRDVIEKFGPVDEKTAKVIESGGSSLKELHRGAARSRCVWATPLEDGVETLLPNCAKARQISRLACARAHLRFQQGRPTGAIVDLMDTMTLGRHVGGEGLLVSVLVDYAIERQAIGVAARHLGELQPAQLDELAARLDRLPPLTTTRQAMQIEREYLLEAFIRDLSGPNAKEKMAWILKEIGGSQDPNLKKLGGVSLEQFRDGLIALRPIYDEIAAMMDRPPAEMKTPETLLAGLSPVARALGMGLLPAVLACRTNEAAHQTRLAMLKASMAVVRRDPEALKAESLKNPYAGGSFSYEKTADGFRLVSKTLDRDRKPVTLEVAQRASK